MSYPVTVNDGIERWCPTCAKVQRIFVEDTGIVRMTCCGTCQRIIQREPSTTVAT